MKHTGDYTEVRERSFAALRMTTRGCVILSAVKECSIPVQKDRTILARGTVYSKRKMRYFLRRSKNVCFS